MHCIPVKGSISPTYYHCPFTVVSLPALVSVSSSLASPNCCRIPWCSHHSDSRLAPGMKPSNLLVSTYPVFTRELLASSNLPQWISMCLGSLSPGHMDTAGN